VVVLHLLDGVLHEALDLCLGELALATVLAARAAGTQAVHVTDESVGSGGAGVLVTPLVAGLGAVVEAVHDAGYHAGVVLGEQLVDAGDARLRQRHVHETFESRLVFGRALLGKVWLTFVLSSYLRQRHRHQHGYYQAQFHNDRDDVGRVHGIRV